MTPCIFSWSGGKDSALALYYCLQDPSLDIRYLVTNINHDADRISMHGVRKELLVKQAESIGIPLYQVRLPEMPGMEEYDRVMHGHLMHFKNEGISHVIYGDIFLEDLRQYRDDRLAAAGLTGIYPLWKRNTRDLIAEFISLGFSTVVACVQERLAEFAGKELDEHLIKNLPADVDPCGENGEFHTFAFKGPVFKKEIRYTTGVKVFKAYDAPKNADDSCVKPDADTPLGFWYCDLMPA